MKLTVLTTACHRPEAWALSESYMKRQTRQPDEWVVLDDDDPKTVCTMGQTYIHNPAWKGRGSLTAKIRHALQNGLIKGDAVVFWENDDWYAPDYLKAMEEWLSQYEMAGEGHSLYYNVRLRYWFDHQNMGHSSLCSTGIRREVFHELGIAANTDDPFVDWRVWQSSRPKKRVYDPNAHGYGRLVLGIKGMPGTSGYGSGHAEQHRTNNSDPHMKKLFALIDEDAAAYEKFAPNMPKGRFVKNIARSECGRVHGDRWLEWLGHLSGKNAVGLELGTFRGESAEWFLENILTHKTSQLFCVDSWEGGDEHKRDKTDFKAVEAEMKKRLMRFGEKVSIQKGFTNKRLPELHYKEAEFDFVYVDAAHDSLNTLRDAVLSFEMLKVGGVMIFDDYAWDNMPRMHDRPKIGVDAFMRAYADEIDVLYEGYQVAIKKVARSPHEQRIQYKHSNPDYSLPQQPAQGFIFQFMGRQDQAP